MVARRQGDQPVSDALTFAHHPNVVLLMPWPSLVADVPLARAPFGGVVSMPSASPWTPRG